MTSPRHIMLGTSLTLTALLKIVSLLNSFQIILICVDHLFPVGSLLIQ